MASSVSGGGANPPGAGHAPAFVPLAPEELARRLPQFEILGLIGHGGMGAVYKARQKSLDRVVALKVLARGQKDPQFSERFALEARTLARLNHPNIIAVFEFGEVEGLCYLVMEYIDGLSLRQLLQTKKLEPKAALAIVPEICAALQYAHDQGIVHRDIKPENLMLDRQGRVKIADFGLAKLLGLNPAQERLTQPKDVMGTPHYMAPEQVEHPQAVDHRADIYSLGVVFYEMLTGELPLGRFAPPSQKVQIDVRLDEVVLHALEKEPERRYQQASQVKTDVETIVSAPAAGERHATAAATTSMEEELPELKAAKRSLRLASIALAALGVAIWSVLLFMEVVGRLFPQEIARALASFLYLPGEYLFRLLPLYSPVAITHIVGTMALVSAWRVRRGQGFAFANAAIFLSFFQAQALPATIPLGIWALVWLWRKEARAAFAAVHGSSRRRDFQQADAVAGYRLAMAGAALLLVSFLCLPAFSLGSLDLAERSALVNAAFSGLRRLPDWTQGVAMILGLTALMLMRQTGGSAKGLGWAVLAALFAPAVWLFSRREGIRFWSWGIDPYALDPTLPRVAYLLFFATLAAGLLALAVDLWKARLVRRGDTNGLARLTNRTCWVAGLLCAAYAAGWAIILRTLSPFQASLIGYELGWAAVLFLIGWLAHRRVGAQQDETCFTPLRLVRGSCWVVGGLFVAYAGAGILATRFPALTVYGDRRDPQFYAFLSLHAHTPLAAEDEGLIPVAHGTAWAIALPVVSEPDASDAQCWFPDGTVRCRASQGVLGPVPLHPGWRELFFTLEGRGKATNLSALHYECLVRDRGAETSRRLGFPRLHNGRQGFRGMLVRVPAGARTARLRLGMPARDWEDTDAVWAWSGPDTIFPRRSIRRAGIDWTFGISGVQERQGELEITFIAQCKLNAEARLVAIDTEGHLHEARFYHGGTVGAPYLPSAVDTTSLNIVGFPGITPQGLKELRFQIRPYQWVEFQNVSLKPGVKTEVKAVDVPEENQAAVRQQAEAGDDECRPFKDFILRKPRFIEFTYQSNPKLPAAATSLGNGEFVPVTDRSFECKWQEGEFFFRMTVRTNYDLATPAVILRESGRHNGTNWEFANGKLCVFDPAIVPAKAKSAELPFGFMGDEESLLTMMNLGLGPFRPGDLQWSGLTFRAKSFVGEDYAGAITSVANDRPATAQITNLVGGAVSRISYAYAGYTTLLGYGVPDGFTMSYILPGGRQIKSLPFQYTRYLATEALAKSSLFDPAKLHANAPVIHYDRNGYR